jgi:phosphatidylglycerophosphate synthase
MADKKSHERVNDILLGPLERPALNWLASHMPAWMTPDGLTIIGVIGAVIILVSYGLSNLEPAFLWVASFGFFINWFGDSLDGTLARYRKIERPKYGFFVDHTVDAFSQVLIFAGLGVSPYVSFSVASLALVGYLLMSILVYVNTFVSGVFRISYSKIGPTEMRILAVLVNALFFFVGIPLLETPLGVIPAYDLIVAIIALILIGAFVISTIKQANEYARNE